MQYTRLTLETGDLEASVVLPLHLAPLAAERMSKLLLQLEKDRESAAAIDTSAYMPERPSLKELRSDILRLANDLEGPNYEPQN